MKLRHSLLAATLLVGLAGAGTGSAAVSATDAWLRSTVPGQQVAAGYVKLRSEEGAALVAVATPVAGRAEIHETSIRDGVMKMRPVGKIALPPGRTVELKPGGYHLMLMKLGHPLKAGDKVPLTLTVERKDGQREQLKVEAEVRSAAPAHGHAH